MAPKKGKANKLARMSDEERARYLQHRADIEEEARRRKQQLIATFMRNKLKREEAFARLNLAKINQHWRKILRDVKCKQMKEELMANWKNFERIMECKRIGIDGLIIELDEAEAQYANNLQAHIVSVDSLIEFHCSALDDLRDKFLSKKRILLDTSRVERDAAEKKFEDDHVHLKRLHFSTLKYHSKEKEKLVDKHIDVLNETKYDAIEDVESLTATKEAEIETLWKKYKDTLNEHLQQTQDIRAEYTDLLKNEVEDTCAIREHTEKVFQATNQIATLKTEFLNFREERKIVVEDLQNQRKEFLEHHSNMKKKMNNGVALDKSQTCHLVTSANKALKYLREIRKKGDQLLYMFSLCSKYQTEREKLLPWGPKDDNFIPISSQKNLKSNADISDDEEKSEFEHEIWKKDFHFDKMTRFWSRMNQAQIDCMDLSAEKKSLKAENNSLKKSLKNYLTELALSQNNPDQKSVLEDLTDDPLLINSDPFVRNRPLTGVEACTSIAVRHEALLRQKSCNARLRH